MDEPTRFRVTVRNGVVRSMGNDGVKVGPQGRVEKVHAANNGLNGICVGSGSTVSGNTAYQNGRDGIQAGSGSAVQRNTVHLNGDYGISFVFPSNGAYRENVITGNAFGTVLNGVNRGDNYCDGPGVASDFCP